ncbi:MAG: tRNA (guanosine(37)-N1)-methyltransferase TrmD [Patescibacteria group bacterium]|nr:tRNA (guanosine(37)-N1)-methyltransferase TrmD [Patescibacteria group bacterium]
MRFFILTLFPHIIENAVDFSILKRAKDKKLIEVIPINIRDFAQDKHKTTDMPPYGGGAGMVLKPEPLFLAVKHVLNTYRLAKKSSEIILLSAGGKLFNQEMAKELANKKDLILMAGHYEGVDERVAEYLATREISIGNYVLSGGEYPALVLLDTVSRLLPEVLENEESLKTESFQEKDVVEYPQYTRPEIYEGLKVPKVLLSGNHKEIELWRKSESERKTKENS